jgi:hypothetical protein
MASDPFRRVRPGEAVRISAIAWNRVLDLVRPSAGADGSQAEQPPLPQTLAVLRRLDEFGRSVTVGEAVVIAPPQYADGGSAAAPATLPLAAGLTFSALERRLGGGPRPGFLRMTPAGGEIDDAFAVCVNPAASRFAIGGFAWARVRAMRPWHRFARRCLVQPGDGATEQANSVGCLDSCGWGPAQIVGWAKPDFDPQTAPTLTTTASTISAGSAGSIYWALIKF